MAESLESFKSYIGKRETATDVVTASAMLKFAAIGVISVPQKPASMPIAPAIVLSIRPRLAGRSSGWVIEAQTRPISSSLVRT